jgi:hypothetical protein
LCHSADDFLLSLQKYRYASAAAADDRLRGISYAEALRARASGFFPRVI